MAPQRWRKIISQETSVQKYLIAGKKDKARKPGNGYLLFAFENAQNSRIVFWRINI
jgi:hypothetical protein